ncbi:MAG: HAMP domain-containing protein, partial [Proteobacteria bacterium]
IIVGFSIFLLAIGLAALLIKGLVVRLRQLWFATQRIAEGDFSSRIDTKGGGSDELAALAGSFNEMSGRISDLMEETAARARMAKELETAQAVQRGFFPKHPYLAPNLRLSGAYQPASECAGDWWGHAVHGDTVYVAIGDVTGHGVSSALVTAAVHGVFYDFVQRPSVESPQCFLSSLVASLHRTVRSTGSEESMMTFLVFALNLQTGAGHFVNASHPSPWVARALSEEGSKQPSRFSMLAGEVTSPLGYAEFGAIIVNEFQLAPGDRFLFCTDGFFEPRPADGKAIKKREFLSMAADAWSHGEVEHQAICDFILQEALSFLGSSAPPDDMTLVVMDIPAAAKFQSALPTALPEALVA